jgi:hypothetical protein
VEHPPYWSAIFATFSSARIGTNWTSFDAALRPAHTTSFKATHLSAFNPNGTTDQTAYEAAYRTAFEAANQATYRPAFEAADGPAFEAAYQTAFVAPHESNRSAFRSAITSAHQPTIESPNSSAHI